MWNCSNSVTQLAQSEGMLQTMHTAKAFDEMLSICLANHWLLELQHHRDDAQSSCDAEQLSSAGLPVNQGHSSIIL